MLQTIKITVSGKVQGVFYRQSTKDMALKLGVCGYVKNLRNGDVFIKATSTKELLDQFCAYCKSGPSKAMVFSIEIREIPVEEFKTFNIER